MDEILIYEAIKFQRVVPARAKFVRFMRSQFESFSLTVKLPGGNDGGGGQKMGSQRWKGGRKRLEQELAESTGAAGNIVLNRKIGILINTRGLSIKGRRGMGCVTMRGEMAER